MVVKCIMNKLKLNQISKKNKKKNVNHPIFNYVCVKATGPWNCVLRNLISIFNWVFFLGGGWLLGEPCFL